VRVVGRGAADGLGGVVDDRVEPLAPDEQVGAEALYRGEVAQVDAVNVQPALPRRRVRQRGEARGGIGGEA
jgi:hypothetical protein